MISYRTHHAYATKFGRRYGPAFLSLPLDRSRSNVALGRTAALLVVIDLQKLKTVPSPTNGTAIPLVHVGGQQGRSIAMSSLACLSK